MKYLLILAMLAISQTALASESVVESLLQRYRHAGANDFNAQRGAVMWQQQHLQPKLNQQVSCASCHSVDLRQSGKHLRTGKHIEPLAPNANPQRLSDAAHISKWFKRNCKWTLGRECTAQEKGDFLLFIQSQ